MCWALADVEIHQRFRGRTIGMYGFPLFVPEGYPSGHLPTGDPMVDKMQSGFISD